MRYQIAREVNPDYSVLEQIFINRDILLEDIPHYLNTTDEDILSPSLLDNIDLAVKTVIKHLSAGHKIFVIVDSDCDGYTSSALILNYLHSLFPSIVENQVYYKMHYVKQHKIDLARIEEGTTLVLVPDAGSNDLEQHRILKEQGIDVVILDHHKADVITEDAILVNNQTCDYPNKALSGVGIAYKFCQRFDEMCGYNNADKFLDLVALGLISDMMSLKTFENRRLITKGLENVTNPFMSEMIDKNSFKLDRENLSPIDVAFYIAPLINAVTRIGEMEEKQVLFDSMLDWKGNALVDSTKRGMKGSLERLCEQAVRTCSNIKNRQNKLKEQGVEQIESLIESDNLLEHKVLTIKLDEITVQKGLTGLIATQLASKYQRPTVVLNKIINPENQIITWEGSARGYDKSRVTDFREFVRESGFAYLAKG